MNPLLRNTIALVSGLLIGNIVNMGIIIMGGTIIPPPAGADVTTSEGLKASIHLFEAKHFVMPFLAHALGTFCGAFVTALIAKSYKLPLALVIGLFFLAGGIMMVTILPSPLWFILLDLGVAYLPMAFLAARIVKKSK